jgi:proline dehydrogenase
VKGIYLEPGAIAHTEPGPIREAFRAQAAQLLDAGHSVSFATHDEELGDGLLADCKRRALPEERYEFQVLMGVQERLWSKWRDAGAKVRAYVPYGPQWRAYSTRRLRKNPQILGHVIRATLGLS